MQLKKHIIILIGLLAIAAGLVSALLVLNKTQGQIPAPVSLEGGATVPVYVFDSPVETLAITHREGSGYILTGLSFDGERALDGTVSDYDRQHVDSSRVCGVLNASRSLYALDLLFDRPRDYAPFGLDEPRATVQVTPSGGQSAVTLLIGDNSAGNEGVYLKLEDKPEIYLIPTYSLENFLLSEAAYLNRAVTAGGESELSKVILGGSVREETGRVVIEKQQDGYVLTAPFSRPLDEMMGLAILRTLLNLSADSVAAVNPTREELVSLGLDNPYSTAEVSGPELGEFFLSATAPDPGGTVYLYREGVPLIYAIQADMLPWLDALYTDLMDPFAYTADIESLDRIEVSDGETLYGFDLAHGADGTLSVSVNGQPLDAEDFRQFYIELISARITGHAADLPPDNPPPVLTFSYLHGSGEKHSVRFYRESPRRYYLETDNGDRFLTASAYVDRVLEELSKHTATGK